MDPAPSVVLLVLLPYFPRKQMLSISFRFVQFFCCLTHFVSIACKTLFVTILKMIWSKLALPLLSRIPSVLVDHCTGQLQLSDCLANPVNIPLTHNRKAKSPACYTIEKSMEKTTPNKEHHYSVFKFFHRIYVVVNISFPFMTLFTQVRHSVFRATLSVTIRDAAV